MKKSIVNLRNLVFLFALAGLISCEGPEGPMGPSGPKGDTGATGAAGPAGPAGEDGEDGNANVTTISLLTEDITWIEGEYLGRIANVFALTNTAVNEDIIDHGTVLGYCHIPLVGEWFQLPFTWEEFDGSARQYIVHTYSPNTITLYAFQTYDVFDPSAIDEYRFLLITDNTVTGAKGASAEENIIRRMTEAGVNVANYHEVMDYFGLKY